jgi:hypothetical protein
MFLKGARILGIVCLLLARAIVSAHHSFAAEFDQNRPVKLTGAVSKVEWVNPHAFIYVDVTGSDGKKETWSCEMGSPNGLMRQGGHDGRSRLATWSRSKDFAPMIIETRRIRVQWSWRTASVCSQTRV